MPGNQVKQGKTTSEPNLVRPVSPIAQALDSEQIDLKATQINPLENEDPDVGFTQYGGIHDFPTAMSNAYNLCHPEIGAPFILDLGFIARTSFVSPGSEESTLEHLVLPLLSPYVYGFTKPFDLGMITLFQHHGSEVKERFVLEANPELSASRNLGGFPHDNVLVQWKRKALALEQQWKADLRDVFERKQISAMNKEIELLEKLEGELESHLGSFQVALGEAVRDVISGDLNAEDRQNHLEILWQFQGILSSKREFRGLDSGIREEIVSSASTPERRVLLEKIAEKRAIIQHYRAVNDTMRKAVGGPLNHPDPRVQGLLESISKVVEDFPYHEVTRVRVKKSWESFLRESLFDRIRKHIRQEDRRPWDVWLGHGAYVSNFSEEILCRIAEGLGLQVKYTQASYRPLGGSVFEEEQRSGGRDSSTSKQDSTESRIEEKLSSTSARGIRESQSSKVQNKAHFRVHSASTVFMSEATRQMIGKRQYGYSVTPGFVLNSVREYEIAMRELSGCTVWMKLNFGAGGDFVKKIENFNTVDPGEDETNFNRELRHLYYRCKEVVQSNNLDASLKELWAPPVDGKATFPTASRSKLRICIEADAASMSPTRTVLFNGCISGVLQGGKKPSLTVTDFFSQISDPEGKNVGSMTADFPKEFLPELEHQIPEFAAYMHNELNLCGIVGGDIIVVEGDRGEPQLYFIEPIARFGVSAVAQLIANQFSTRWVPKGQKVFMCQENFAFNDYFDSVERFNRLFEHAGYNPMMVLPDDPDYRPEIGMIIPIEYKTRYFRTMSRGVKPIEGRRSRVVKLLYLDPFARSTDDLAITHKRARAFLEEAQDSFANVG